MCCKIIEKYPKYSVSIYGEVISNKTGNILKAWDCKSYLYVTLRHDGLKTAVAVHRLVLETFCPQDPAVAKLYQAHHVDGDTYNNALDNLEWILASEHRRECSTQSKYLSQETVINILDDYFVYNLTNSDICTKYKVNTRTVTNLVNLITYKKLIPQNKLEFYQAKRKDMLSNRMDQKEIAYVKYKFLVEEEMISRDGISQKAIEQQCKNAKVQLDRDFSGNKEEMKRRGIISSSTGDGEPNEDK